MSYNTIENLTYSEKTNQPKPENLSLYWHRNRLKISPFYSEVMVAMTQTNVENRKQKYEKFVID